MHNGAEASAAFAAMADIEPAELGEHREHPLSNYELDTYAMVYLEAIIMADLGG